MGALRRAGVWLGLVEDEDERGYDDHRNYRGYGDDFDDEDVDDVPVPPRARMGGGDRLALDRGGVSGERISGGAGDRHERLSDRHSSERMANDRTNGDRLGGDRLGGDRMGDDRLSDRLSERLAERDSGVATRSTVRSITRPTSTVSYPTRDNLALAPQVQPQSRTVVDEESEHSRYAITTLHPTTYSEARTIGEHFREGGPVIMNLTEMDEPDAKRLVDFAAGLVFGLRGNFERVTNRVFLLSPANVQVTAEDKAKIAEGGFFNQS
jgi:cell division inhibitor SepF